MTTVPILALYIDDEPALLNIGKAFLERGGAFQVDIVGSAAEALQAMAVREYDAIISDYQMPEMDGIKLLKAVRQSGNEIPFILFTGKGREEVVIEALNEGADFYLQKGGDPMAQFAELAHKVRQAVKRRQAELSQTESEKRLADIINFLPDATFAIDRGGHIIAWNRAIEEMTGLPASEMIGKGNFEYAVPFYGARRKILIDLIFEPDDVIAKNYAHIIHEKDILIAETSLPRPKGNVVTLMGKASPLYDRKGEIVGAIESIRDISERNKAEEELRKSEDRFSRAIAGTGAGLWDWDMVNDRVFFSLQWKTMLGYGDPEVENNFSGWKNLWHPDDAARIEKAVSDYLEGKTTKYEIEHRLRHKDGSWHWILTRGDIHRDAEGRPVRWTGTNIDITERKLDEDELRAAYEQLTASEERLKANLETLTRQDQIIRESESRLRSFIDTTSDAVMIIDEEGKVIEWNAGSEQISGISKEDAIGRYWWDVVIRLVPRERRTEERRAALEQMIRTGLSTGVPAFTGPNVTEIERPDSTSVIIRQTIFPIKTEKGFRFGTISQDITAECRGNEALMESEQKYRTLVETTGTGFVIIDALGNVLDANPEYVRLTGHTGLAEIAGRSVLEWTAVYEKEKNAQAVQQCIRNGFIRNFEIDYISTTGTITPIEINATVLESGERIRILTLCRDITERRRAEEEATLLACLNDLSPASVTVHTPEGEMLYANQRTLELHGWTREEFMAKNLHEIDVPGSEQLINERIELLRRTGEASFDVEHFRKDGSTVPLNVTAKITTWNGRDVLLSVSTDISERMQSEAALKESEARLQSVLNGSPILQFVIDLNHRVISWNKAIEEYSGISAADILGTDQHWRPFYPEKRPVLADLVVDGNTDGLFKWYAGKLQKSRNVDGAYEATDFFPRMGTAGTWLSFTAAPVLDAKGAIIGAVETLEDITERIAADNALRENEGRYRLITENTADHIWIFDMNMRMTYTSPSVTRMKGFTVEETLSKSLQDMMTPDSAESVLKRFHDEMALEAAGTANPGRTISFETEEYCKDGTTIIVENAVTMLRDSAGMPVGILGVSRDITVRRKALAALADSEELYRKLVSTVPDLVARTDLAGNIVYINETGITMSGYATANDVLGKSVFSFFSPEDLPRAIENTKQMFARQLGPVEYTFISRDGNRLSLEVNGDVLRTPSGEPYGMVYVGRDITGRKRAEEGLRDANKKLTLLSSITRHDIINNISVCRGYLALARLESSNAEMQRFIKILEESMETIQSQIDFTRIYQDLGTADLVWQDIGEVLRKCSAAKSIPVESGIQDLEVFADPLLGRVFYNLMDNAVRHGGHVSAIRVHAEQRGDEMMIAWEDNGVGIPADEKAKIFEQGYGRNTGLGLFLVREVLALTGITIHETGEPGRGARFEMTIPKGAWRIIPARQ